MQLKPKGAGKRGLASLVRAAMAIPTVGAGLTAQAQTPPEFATVRFQYSDYSDFQSNADRMRVRAPMLSLQTPLGDRWELESSLVVDSISGASPLYLSTVSGASGTGIRDERTAGDLKLTHYFDRFSLSAGGVYSTEDDYESAGGSLESRIWTEDKNTTLALGISGNSDTITSSNDSTLHESRDAGSLLIGVTQILSPVSLIQSNLTFAGGDGYFSDPYKLLDHRPRSRDEFAWLVRHVRSFTDMKASLHTDYRFFTDSWGLTAHTFEAALYQTFGDHWTIRPAVRYYTQSEADFFSSEYPPRNNPSFYASDQRLSAFGGLTTGVKIFYHLTDGFTFDAGYDFLQQRSSFRPGGGSDGIRAFYASFFSVGITKRFDVK